jgi:ribosomal protein S1
MFTQQIRSSYSKLFKGNQQFKSEFMPEVNQKCYQTQKLTIGTIVKITSTNIYFDVNSKNFIKTKQKKFINTFYKIYKELTNTQNYSIKDFLNEIKLRKSFKFILYKLKSSDDNLFIDYDKTFEYFYYQKLFYELEHLKKSKQTIKGYLLNNINGGFSVAVGGIVAFVPNNILTINQQQIKNNQLFTKSIINFKISNINFNRKNIILTSVKL